MGEIKQVVVESEEELPVVCVEPFGDKFVVVDYSDEENVRYSGKSRNWILGHPFVEDPFDTLEEASTFADKVLQENSLSG